MSLGRSGGGFGFERRSLRQVTPMGAQTWSGGASVLDVPFARPRLAEVDDTDGERFAYVGGLDLGKVRDNAALSVLRRTVVGGRFRGPVDDRWHMRLCSNIELQTDYVDIARFVLSLPLSVLIFDATGGGIPVYDILRREAMALGFRGRIKAATLVSSRTEKSMTREKGFVSIPKKELVTAIEAAVQKGCIVPAIDAQDDWRRMMAQAATFERVQGPTGNISYRASGKDQGRNKDDLVIAFGLAAWWVMHFRKSQASIFM